MNEPTPDLGEITTWIAGLGADDEEVEVYAVARADLDVRAVEGEIESFSSADVAGIGVRVIRDRRQGFAYTGLLDRDAAAEVLDDARNNAAYGTEDHDLGLVARADIVDVPEPELDLVAPGFNAMSADAKVELALDLEGRVRAGDGRIRSVQADYGDARVELAIANSRGIASRQQRTIASASAYAVVEDEIGGDMQTRTGFGYDLARDPTDLVADSIADEAITRATRLLGAEQPDSQRVAVVLDPFVTAQFCGIVAGTLNGEAVLKGRSIFADRVGEAIAAECVSLVDDPTDSAAFGAAPFDAEGVPTRRLDLVSDGVLGAFAQNTYTARRLETVTTGSARRASYKSTPGVGTRAFGFAAGDATLDALLARADGGVYIQSVQGLHSGVNPVSGDFSTGAEGLWITDGALGAPFGEATIASTLQRMLLDVIEVGGDVRMLAGGPAVPVLVGEMTLGGK